MQVSPTDLFVTPCQNDVYQHHRKTSPTSSKTQDRLLIRALIALACICRRSPLPLYFALQSGCLGLRRWPAGTAGASPCEGVRAMSMTGETKTGILTKPR